MAEKPLDKKEIEELRRLFNLLEKDINEVDFNNLIKSGEAARITLAAMRKEIVGIKNDVGEAWEGFKGVVAEIKKTKEGINQAARSFNAIASLAEKIQFHQKKISKLTEDELDDIIIKLNKEKQRLANADALLKIDQKQLQAKKQQGENLQKQLEREIEILNQKQNISDKDLERAEQLQKKLNRTNVILDKTNAQLEENAATQKNIEGILTEQDEHYKTLQKAIIQTNKELEDQRKLMGLVGSAMGGLDTAMSKLGLSSLTQALGIREAQQAMVDEADAIREAGGDVDNLNNKFQVLGVGVQMMGRALLKHLKDPAVVTAFVVDQMIDALTSADKATGELAKGMNMTYAEASKTRQELNSMANMSMDAALNTRALQESMMAVGAALGTNAQLNEKDLKTFTKLREQAGLTNEELTAMQSITLATGGNLEDNTKEFLGSAKALSVEKGLAINVKQVLKETAGVSNAIKLSLGGTPKALAEAAIKAKEMGINLEQADKMASSLLNFEDSISAELEAELLTGKNINLEAARLAALNGDIGTVAEEINAQLGGSAEFTKMNRIQQEAMAKAVGMTREELANSLIEQEALATIGRDLNEKESEAYEAAKQKYGAKKAAQMLADGELDTMMKQQSIQERFNQSIEKLKEVFISLADPILAIVDPLANLVSAILPAINLLLQPVFFIIRSIADAVQSFTSLLNGDMKSGFDGVLQIVQSIAVIWAGIVLGAKLLGKETMKNITLQGVLGNLLKKDFWKSIGTSIAKAWGSIVSFLGPFGIPVAIAAGAGLVSLASGLFSKGDDVTSEPGYGKRTLLHPEGAIALNDNDTVIAGTNLGGGGKSSPSNEGNNSSMASELAAIKNILQQIASTPGIVQIDGAAAGKVLAPLVNQSNLQTQVKTQ
jgi:hypothetical protein